MCQWSNADFLGVCSVICSLRLTGLRVRRSEIKGGRSGFISVGPCRPQATRFARRVALWLKSFSHAKAQRRKKTAKLKTQVSLRLLCAFAPLRLCVKYFLGPVLHARLSIFL